MVLKRIILFWKSIGFTLVILKLSFASPSTFKHIPTIIINDKIVHLIIYAILTFILIYDYRQVIKTSLNSSNFIVICMVYPILLGGVVEILQGRYFPPRDSDFFDWIFNVIGILSVYLSRNLIFRNTPK